jgi:hypothetical protein
MVLLFAIPRSGKGRNLLISRRNYKLPIHEMTGQRKIRGSGVPVTLDADPDFVGLNLVCLRAMNSLSKK